MNNPRNDLKMTRVAFELPLSPGARIPKTISLWILSTVMCSACTLDFEEFQPYTTPEGYRDAEPVPDMDPMVDMDPGIDMIVEDGFIVEPDLGMDLDGDGVLDQVDNCPEVSNMDQVDTDSDDIGDACDDDDDDGILDYRSDGMGGGVQNDNCLGVPNVDQKDTDWDLIGDACDEDIDGDGLNTQAEMELGTDPSVADSDRDGIIDGVDLCPLVPSSGRDLDADGVDDACDLDDDNDLILDWIDACPFHADSEQAATPEEAQAGRGSACALDFDADGIDDVNDPCPLIPALDETDLDRCLTAPLLWGFDGDVLDLEIDKQYLWVATSGGLSRLNLNPESAQIDPETERRIDVVSGLWSAETQSVKAFTAYGPNQLTIRGAWVINGGRLSVVRYDGITSNYFASETDLSPQGVTQIYDLVADASGAFMATDVGLLKVSYEGVQTVQVGDQPNAPVTALRYDHEDQRLWIATGNTLYQGKLDDLQALTLEATLEGVNTIKRLRLPSNATELIILTDTEVILYDTITHLEGSPRLSISAYDALRRLDGLYLATEAGLVSTSIAGEISSPAIRGLGGALITVIEQVSLAGDLLIGGRSKGISSGRGDGLASEGGIKEGDAVWFTRSLEEETCYVEALPLQQGDLLVGTTTGLYIRSGDGAQVLLHEAPIYDVNTNDQYGWAAAQDNVVRVSLADSSVQFYPETGLTPPYTAIYASQTEVWVAGQDGISRGVINQDTGGIDVWNPYLSAQVPTLPVGEVVALGQESDTTWIAVRGGGVARFANGAFNDTIYSSGNGFLPSDLITDMSVTAQRITVTTEAGVAIFKPILQNQNDLAVLYNGAGLPNQSGSHALSAVDTGKRLWLMMAPTQLQPYGSLVSIEVDDPNSPLRTLGSERLFTASEVDVLVSSLPTTVRGERSHSKLSISGLRDELKVTLSTCGDMTSSGVIGVLDGHRSLEAYLTARHLEGGDEGALIPSPRGHAMFTSAYGELIREDGMDLGPGEVRTRDVYLPLAEGEEWPANRDPRRVIIGSDRLNHPLKDCRAFQQTGDVVKRLICFTDKNYLARHVTNTWTQEENPLLDDQALIIYDFLLDSDNPNSVWIGTSGGLVSLRVNTPTVISVANSREGLPSDKVRALAWSSAQRLLFIGTDKGLVRLSLASDLPPDPSQGEWTPLGRDLPVLRRPISALTFDQRDGSLWVGVEGGLLRLLEPQAPSGESAYEAYPVGEALPSGKINSIAVSGETLFVSHESGVSSLTAGAWSHFGYREGVSSPKGRFVVDDRGGVWILSARGALGFKPPSAP